MVLEALATKTHSVLPFYSMRGVLFPHLASQYTLNLFNMKFHFSQHENSQTELDEVVIKQNSLI